MKRIFFVLFCSLFLVACNPKSKTEAELNQNEKEEDTVDVLTAVSDSIALDSTNYNLYLRRARIYLGREQVGAAMVDINQAIVLNPKNVDAYLVLADAYYGLGDENNITVALNKAIDINAQDARPYVKLAELNILQQKYNLANGYIDEALNISKFNPKAYFVRGMLYLTLQDTTAALKSFMLAREQDDKFYEPLKQIGQIYAAQNNPLAESFMRDAVEKFPDEYIARYELALYLQDNGKPVEALAHYDTMLMAQPTNSRLLFNKGYVNLIYIGDYEAALGFFEDALKSDPGYIDALYNKGLTMEQMGNYKEAKDVYLEVLRRKPDYALATEAVNRLQN